MVLRLGSKVGGFGTNAVMSVMTHARMVFRICLVSPAAETIVLRMNHGDGAKHERTTDHSCFSMPTARGRRCKRAGPDPFTLSSRCKDRQCRARNRLAPWPRSCFSFVAGERARGCDQEPDPKIIHASLRLTTPAPLLTPALHHRHLRCRCRCHCYCHRLADVFGRPSLRKRAATCTCMPVKRSRPHSARPRLLVHRPLRLRETSTFARNSPAGRPHLRPHPTSLFAPTASCAAPAVARIDCASSWRAPLAPVKESWKTVRAPLDMS
jgi:hypothetical protein